MPNITFTDTLNGDLNPGVGFITPVADSPTQVDPVVMILDAHAVISVDVPPPTPPVLDRRVRNAIVVTMPTPVINRGRPGVPSIGGRVTVSGSALAGVGHLRGFADPDPVWDGTEYSVPPPPVSAAGAHLMRWTTRTLPNPGSGKYLLGTPDSRDGTTGSTATGWHTAPGSDVALTWTSSFPFKPTVQNHIHYGEDGSVYTEAAGVHLTPHRVSQMWCDFGTYLTPPFTMLAVAVVTDFPSRSYLNYLFDAGEDPGTDLTAAQRAAIWAGGLNGDIALTESFGYRNCLRAGRTQLSAFTDPVASTRIARVPYDHTIKPKVMAMVINGAKSQFYVRDAYRRYVKTQSMANHGAQRLWVMGRRNGLLSALAGCAMVVFEIRAWDKALTEDDLDAQFAALSSTWKLHSYR